MDTGGGTGAVEQESDSDQSDSLRAGVVIIVETLPTTIQTIGTPPNQYNINVHTVRVHTETTQIDIHVRGLTHAPANLLLTVGEELIRAARSRVRHGTVQITHL